MSEQKSIDDITEIVRQSIIDTKSKKHCMRDFSGDIFELTPEMQIKGRRFNKEEKSELAGIAECILQKYSKLLCVIK